MCCYKPGLSHLNLQGMTVQVSKLLLHYRLYTVYASNEFCGRFIGQKKNYSDDYIKTFGTPGQFPPPLDVHCQKKLDLPTPIKVKLMVRLWKAEVPASPSGYGNKL